MTNLPSLPDTRPARPYFSSGPCVKRPGWSPAVLADACLGQSHRGKAARAKLAALFEKTRTILGIPADYRLAIVPASDTGAMEMALWSMLGARGVDILAWEIFGEGWATDIVKQLKLTDSRVLRADYGALPDLTALDWNHDVVFTWNGTTSGVRVPNGDWIPPDRAGLAICDGTSAVFAMDLPWQKLDVITWSWQKVLGGEAQHGMLVLSPRAVARLESYTPPWPLPKLFRLTKGGKLNGGIFEGATINTPSMLCIEDQLDALNWAQSLGGLTALLARTQANATAIADWVERTPWVEFLARIPAQRSTTSVCLTLVDPWFTGLDEPAQRGLISRLAGLLAAQNAAFDIAGHRDAPPHLRIWAGATVDTADLIALMPWLDWAYAQAKSTI